ncbi:hypothetical protein Bealeia1_01467 [Candidatus Bealeia paramacronuclearis]|uniref:Uncharacterized protein n=1 Tax=Candidatus Bealeia paramacronuclearis TaxID=1921001 RepID=A0ABZ2C4H6_9PROT|nr:hypothetical protein [Candidatus Bealeia paramacronuclearis]
MLFSKSRFFLTTSLLAILMSPVLSAMDDQDQTPGTISKKKKTLATQEENEDQKLQNIKDYLNAYEVYAHASLDYISEKLSDFVGPIVNIIYNCLDTYDLAESKSASLADAMKVILKSDVTKEDFLDSEKFTIKLKKALLISITSSTSSDFLTAPLIAFIQNKVTLREQDNLKFFTHLSSTLSSNASSIHSTQVSYNTKESKVTYENGRINELFDFYQFTFEDFQAFKRLQQKVKTSLTLENARNFVIEYNKIRQITRFEFLIVARQKKVPFYLLTMNFDDPWINQTLFHKKEDVAASKRLIKMLNIPNKEAPDFDSLPFYMRGAELFFEGWCISDDFEIQKKQDNSKLKSLQIVDPSGYVTKQKIQHDFQYFSTAFVKQENSKYAEAMKTQKKRKNELKKKQAEEQEKLEAIKKKTTTPSKTNAPQTTPKKTKETSLKVEDNILLSQSEETPVLITSTAKMNEIKQEVPGHIPSDHQLSQLYEGEKLPKNPVKKEKPLNKGKKEAILNEIEEKKEVEKKNENQNVRPSSVLYDYDDPIFNDIFTTNKTVEMKVVFQVFKNLKLKFTITEGSHGTLHYFPDSKSKTPHPYTGHFFELHGARTHYYSNEIGWLATIFQNWGLIGDLRDYSPKS